VAALRDAGLTVFAGDDSGVRVKKVDPDATATYYVSEGHEVIGGVHTTYEFPGNVRFAQARGAEVTCFVQDHLHSTSASLAPDGSLRESGAYLPFGVDRTPASVTATSYGFTDQERDRSTGFYNYDARQYDPEASRFISPDSLLPDPYDPQQLNRYAYARNNRLKYVDPSGHESGNLNDDINSKIGADGSINPNEEKQSPDDGSCVGCTPSAKKDALQEPAWYEDPIELLSIFGSSLAAVARSYIGAFSAGVKAVVTTEIRTSAAVSSAAQKALYTSEKKLQDLSRKKWLSMLKSLKLTKKIRMLLIIWGS